MKFTCSESSISTLAITKIIQRTLNVQGESNFEEVVGILSMIILIWIKALIGQMALKTGADFKETMCLS